MIKHTKLAVIDIGSNSVRMVIYDELKRSPIPIFNEKILCGLGEDIVSTHKLSISGKDLAIKAMRRFKIILDSYSITSIYPIATSAIREAIDGEEFVKEIESVLSVKVEIISGKKEANLSALGVISSIPHAKGIVVDLGGGSVELSQIADGDIIKAESYNYGVLTFAERISHEGGTKDILRSFMEFCQSDESNHLYLVGGSFRNLAKIHIYMQNYPIRILHNLDITVADLIKTLADLRLMKKKQMKELSVLSTTRIEHVMVACDILELLLTSKEFKFITFSAFGIREGFLYSLLDEKTQAQDPLISGCEDLILRSDGNVESGYQIFDWITPIFPNDALNNQRIRLAASILGSLARYEHNEYRAHLSFHKFMDSNITGISHRYRLLIALSLYYRYKANAEDTILSFCSKFLNSEELLLAKKIGYSLRFAFAITGGSDELLAKVKLSLENHNITFSAEPPYQDLLGEVVDKHFSKLSQIYQQS